MIRDGRTSHHRITLLMHTISDASTATAVDNDDDEEESKKKFKDGDEQQQGEGDTDAAAADEDAEEEKNDAQDNDNDDTTAVKHEPTNPTPLAWKYEDDSAVVTVRTHAPGDDSADEEDGQQPAAAEAGGEYERAGGWVGRQLGREQVQSVKKAVVKIKKKDRKGPKRMMKSKKEKALGVKKKPRFRGR